MNVDCQRHDIRSICGSLPPLYMVIWGNTEEWVPVERVAAQVLTFPSPFVSCLQQIRVIDIFQLSRVTVVVSTHPPSRPMWAPRNGRQIDGIKVIPQLGSYCTALPRAGRTPTPGKGPRKKKAKGAP